MSELEEVCKNTKSRILPSFLRRMTDMEKGWGGEKACCETAQVVAERLSFLSTHDY